MSIDGWLTPTYRKWLGFCRILRPQYSGDVLLDVSRFQDVTEVGETEEVVTFELEKVLSAIEKELENSKGSRMISVISDSASSNVNAKKNLIEEVSFFVSLCPALLISLTLWQEIY